MGDWGIKTAIDYCDYCFKPGFSQNVDSAWPLFSKRRHGRKSSLLSGDDRIPKLDAAGLWPSTSKSTVCLNPLHPSRHYAIISRTIPLGKVGQAASAAVAFVAFYRT
jgi:hypothetical protein